MSTIRGVKDRRFKFTQLLNCMFEDSELSLKAKGLIGYCLTKTEDWKFHMKHLSSVLKEGERALYSTLNECIEQGYAIRYQLHKENGDFDHWETIVSDSKEEILALKKEMSEKPEFKEMFTQRCFADAHCAVARNVSHSNNETTQEISETTTEDVVVGAENAPVSGKKDQDLTLDDVHHFCVSHRKDWSSQEIESAWSAFLKSVNPIHDVLRYIEGIIKKQRLITENKKSRQGITCQPTTFLNTSTKSLETNKNSSSEEDTGEHLLARFTYREMFKRKLAAS